MILIEFNINFIINIRCERDELLYIFTFGTRGIVMITSLMMHVKSFTIEL